MPLTPPAVAPHARVEPETRRFHERTLVDDYGWLRDEKWQEVMRNPDALSQDIRDYLEAENAYVAETFAPLSDLKETLYQEIKGRIKEDDSSVPARDGDWFYVTKYETGAQHPLFCRYGASDEEEKTQVILDANKQADGLDYFKLGAVEHTNCHQWLAWSADLKGSEYFTVHIRNLENGEDLDYVINDTSGSAVWSPCGTYLYYTRLDENHRPVTVFRHKRGTDPKDDVVLYDEQDPGFYLGVGATQNGRFIVISASDHQTCEMWVIDGETPEAAPSLIDAREPGVEYDIDHDAVRDRFIILTNRDAEDFKLVTAPLDFPDHSHWEDLIKHTPGTLILGHTSYQDFHVRLERKDGLKRIILRHLESNAETAIDFDEAAYDLSLYSGFEYDTHSLRFGYSSMTTPAQVFDFNMDTAERRLLKTQEVPSGHEISDYITERVFAKADDGVRVPISLLYHKDTPLDGSAPLLLYGYGSYGISMDPSFSVSCLSLVNRGFVYAIAHIRGGKEGGYDWYKSAKMMTKKTTFTDFIQCGEYLAHKNYTSRGNITIHGGSAGGMLVGACANIAPDLFKGVVAEVPFVDVLNTMLDASLPLTPPEWLEWGNPIEDADAYDYMASYSPYDNVSAQSYPHIFAIAGLTDPRVTYWEPAKWVARLRATRTDGNLTLLKTNMGAGHGGASGRFDRLKEVADVYCFALAIHGKA